MRARSQDEIDVYIRRHPCSRCGASIEASDLEYSATAIDANEARYAFRGTCRTCGNALSFEFDGPNRWPELPPLAYGGPESSTILDANDWIEEAEWLAAQVPEDPGALEPRAFFAHNGQIRSAIGMLEEAKKFPDVSHASIDARKAKLERTCARYAALRDEMARRAESARSNAPPKPRLSLDRLKAHALWLTNRRTGEGRLDVEGGSVGGLPLGNLKAAEGRMVRVSLDGAKIDFAHFERAELIECTARKASFPHTKFDGARLERCNFEGAGLVLTNFIDATIVGGNFRRINADRGAWNGITMNGVDFREARFGDCVLNGALIENCDFRDADLGRVSTLLKLCMTFNTTFRNCDLRGVNFEGRRLRDTRFIDCKFASVRGKPAIEGPYFVERPDFSSAGDGSDIRGPEAVYAMWGQA